MSVGAEITVPMHVFGDPFFSDNNGRVGSWVHLWCHAAWKRDPSADLVDDAELAAAMRHGWVTPDGKRLTGPYRNPRWLVAERPRYSTYAIAALGTGMVKIGKAHDVVRRLDVLQIASPHELVLVSAIDQDIESRLHDALSDWWVRGEWHRLDDRVVAIMASFGMEIAAGVAR